MESAPGVGTSLRVRRGNGVWRLRRILVASAVVLAVGLIIICTRWGAALSDDSYVYIKPARDALAGRAIELDTGFPPFLPIVLTGIGLLGIEPLVAIRFLNALLFGATVLLSFLIVLEMSRSFTFSFLACVAILTTSGLIEVFTSALSEPLYISLALASIYSTARYSRGSRRTWLIAAAVAAGLALFTRYAGLSIAIAIPLFLLSRTSLPWRKRAKDALLFCLISAIPISGYVVRNLLITGRPVGQSGFSWELMRRFPWRTLLRDVFDWLIPGRLVAGHEEALGLLLLLFILGVIAGYWFVYRRRASRSAKNLFRSEPFVLVALFVAANLVLLSIARGFFQGGDPFNPRYLCPVQLAAFMLFFGLLGRLYPVIGRLSHVVIAGACLAFFALLALRAIYTIQYLYREGSGYSSHRWHISETIAYLNHRPETPVMSTGAIGVYFWTGRRPADIPRLNSREAVREFLCDTGGFLVIIDSMPTEFYGIDHPELTEGLIVEQDFSEGTIYRVDPADCRQ
jgi:hypothetical protein